MAKRSKAKERRMAEDAANTDVQSGLVTELAAAPQVENTEPVELKEEDLKEVATQTPFEDVMPDEGAVAEENAAVAAVEEDNEKPNSVVAPKFKDLYLRKAREAGIAGKAAKRSNWDWLSQTIAANCLKEKEKIDITAFTAILEANGVDYSKWTNRNKGWEGRFRMTGRVALQKIVAANGVLKLADGSEAVAPEEWKNKYKKAE